MTEDLIAFLNARLNEDQQAAQHVAAEYGETWRDDDDWVRGSNGADVVDEPGAPVAHIARHDPAFVLADIDAKRRIMECHEPWVAENGDTICGRCGREHIDGRPGGHFPCQTLRLLALPYADHPDYRPEWAP
ncbi:DUF6221 family protein [Streptomyces sp. NPDC020983]|uniref:DUF6221 family protein n=1 Tax=Streptomyces sp. NPDC020983 TaxID=3365106 RepID=UPI0037A63C9A